MIFQLIRPKRRQILIDISTQKDLFLADGNACINNHRRVLTNVRRMVAWARSKHLPVISTCQVYPRNNGNPGYCIEGTEGQKKIRYTLLDNRINFVADGNMDLPRDVLRKHRQIILHQRCTDPFQEPRIERLFSEMQGGEFILIGAYAESAVEATALGLLQRGKKVTVITDAVGSSDRKKADMALRKIKAKGAKLVEAKKLAGTSHLKTVGICHCPRCLPYSQKGFGKEIAFN
ncbi:MAG: cysteine hydrolase family protein [Planctomycetota bacterium]|jgi:nicotinamidase-related amidase